MTQTMGTDISADLILAAATTTTTQKEGEQAFERLMFLAEKEYRQPVTDEKTFGAHASTQSFTDNRLRS